MEKIPVTVGAALPWASEPCLMGIDEAGRGPVLGPMVYGTAFCPLKAQQALSKRAFADSKTLTEDKRETLYEEIAEDSSLGYLVDVVTAESLSAQMLQSEKISLNAIANEQTFRLIDEVLGLGVNVKECYVDTVGDAARWQQKLTERYPAIRFTVCPKADAIYPIVSAASIVAKVTRDRALKSFQIVEGSSSNAAFGSGYPGDPVTIAWLEANLDHIFGAPNLVRFSWSTCSKLLEEKAVKVHWECEEGLESGQRALTFGSTPTCKPKASSGAGRHSYFKARKLQRITQI